MKLFPAAAALALITVAGCSKKRDPNIVVFDCKNGQKIRADFHFAGKDQLSLKLADGRSMTLPHTASSSGLRYASNDDKIIFWTKGDDAVFEEDGERTFGECTAD